MFYDFEGGVGAEVEALGGGGEQRSFGGGGAGADGEVDGGIGGQGGWGAEGEPAPGRGVLYQAANPFVGGDLCFCSQLYCYRLAVGGDVGGGQDPGRVNLLVEGEEEDGFQRLGAAVGVVANQARWRCGKAPGDAFGQGAAVGGGGPGRDFGHVFGGHGEAVEFAALIFKGERLGAQPAPDAGDVGGEAHGDVGSGQGFQGGQGHHGLVEGYVEEGGERDLALGGVAQHGQRPGDQVGRGGGWGGRREGLADGCAGAGRGEGDGGQLEADGVAGAAADGRQAGQEEGCLFVAEGGAGGQGQGLVGGLGGLPFAQANLQAAFTAGLGGGGGFYADDGGGGLAARPAAIDQEDGGGSDPQQQDDGR